MNEWINCKERLPEKEGRYIVYVPFTAYPWIGVSSYRKDKFDDSIATHWIELPPPPEKIK